MKLSVIIPTLNEEAYVSRILSDLQKQLVKPKEIIVVDGKSADNTVKIVSKKFPSVKLVNSHSPVGFQRSFGGRVAQGEWLLFLDADTSINDKFIFDFQNLTKLDNFDLACFWYEPVTKSKQVKLFFRVFNEIFLRSQSKVPSGAGPGIVVRKRLFDQAGGFREVTFDDIEFIRRASKIGRFRFFTQPKVYVSDRRFQKYGITRTILKHLLLSLLFSVGIYHINLLKFYPFGEYNQN